MQSDIMAGINTVSIVVERFLTAHSGPISATQASPRRHSHSRRPSQTQQTHM